MAEKGVANEKEKGKGGGAPASTQSGAGGEVATASSSSASASAKLAARIEELERRLSAAQRELEAGALERAIEAALSSSGVIDAETGRLLVEHALESEPELGVEEAVSRLRSRKGFLFASGGGGGSPFAGGAALAARGAPAGEAEELASMKASASGSGERGELLRYLRARRSA